MPGSGPEEGLREKTRSLDWIRSVSWKIKKGQSSLTWVNFRGRAAGASRKGVALLIFGAAFLADGLAGGHFPLSTGHFMELRHSAINAIDGEQVRE
jgi:hypothetical protein